MKKIAKRLLRRFHWPVSSLYYLSGTALRKIYPEWQPRLWSNLELRKWGPLVEGDIINVSGWEDSDKHGGRYHEYFPNKRSYTVSNIAGARGASAEKHGQKEVFIDLTAPLAPEYRGQFDVVFNHTVLEHVFPLKTAIQNLCELSRDLVIVVVPFLQQMHWESGSYGDYWRLTPFALEEFFREHGFEAVYCTHNDNPVTDVYLFYVASRRPEKWRAIIKEKGMSLPRTEVGNHPGRHFAALRMPEGL